MPHGVGECALFVCPQQRCILKLTTTHQLVIYGVGIAIAHMTVYGLGRHVYIMNPANIPLYLRVSL